MKLSEFQESIKAAPKPRLPVEQEVVPALPCPAIRANGSVLLRNANKPNAMRYIDSKITVRSVQSFHNRKESEFLLIVKIFKKS
jgi:hypothetical protein